MSDLDTKNPTNADSASDAQILERMLYPLYDADCHDLAARLIERFGSLYDVFCATLRELEAIPGMTHRIASLFTLAKPVLKQALLRSTYACDCERGLMVTTCIEYMHRREPFLACVYTDEYGHVVNIKSLSGTRNTKSAIDGGARADARHYAIIQFSPYRFGEFSDCAELSNIITKLNKLDMLFIDYVKFDGTRFVSLRRAADGDLQPFNLCDLDQSSVERKVCSASDLNKILRFIEKP